MDKLIKRRSTIKSSITKIETFVLKNEKDKKVDVNEFVVREEHLVKAIEEYGEIQTQIEEHDAAQESDRDEIETKYFSLVAKIRTIVKSRAKVEIKTPARDSSSPSTNRTLQHPPQYFENSQAVKLPSLNVPTFNGQYEDWKSFFDIFCALIHSDTKLSNVQKFLYLKTALKGEPLTLIEDLKVTNDNYDSAINILKARYDNRLSIINSHIKALLEIPQVNKMNCATLRDFLTKVKKHINALSSLKVPVEQWDVILVYIFSNKLDFNTHKAYELERDSNVNELPKWKEFLDFLEKRCIALERISSSTHEKVNKYEVKHENKTIRSASHLSGNKAYDNNQNNQSQRYSCLFCKLSNHNIYKCTKFATIPISEKKTFIANNKLCFNCLGSKHFVWQCTGRKCTQCGGSHHSLIHEETRTKAQGLPQNDTDKKQPSASSANVSASSDNAAVNSESIDWDSQNTSCLHGLQTLNQNIKTVLLATAKVVLISSNGNKITCRALMDTGSMNTFITTQMMHKLNLPFVHSNMEVTGIGNNKILTSKQVNLCIRSLVEKNFTLSANCTVLDKITCPLPQTKLDIGSLNIKNVQLSDPDFYIPSEIDMLIGSDLYYEIIQPGIIKLGDNMPTIQNTKLGWVIGGPIPETRRSNNVAVSLFSHIDYDINELMPKFWQLEEVNTKRFMSQEDKICETIFTKTTKRLIDGRFQVDLPLRDKDDVRKLGHSYHLARERFISLEKKLHKDKNLFKEYKDFIDEYIKLGHGRFVNFNENGSITRNFFPHFCVIRDQSTSTRLRVVFDSSMKTSTQVSLNDILLKGFTVQPDLFDIICRFRCFIYVLIADIQKMYRQIKINPSQTYLQSILWRDKPDDSIKCVELETVTYGTNCAPFLATRCLVKLANDEMKKYPLAAKALLEQCYVDDILAGNNSQEGICQLYNELVSLLSLGGFQLHKWQSNSDSVLNLIPSSKKDTDKVTFVESPNSTKVLGLTWTPSEDCFRISLGKSGTSDNATKRSVLSCIAQMYDPLGLIGPVIVTAKMLMQQIWCSKINWDDFLPPQLLEAWKKFSLNLGVVMELKIHRPLILNSDYVEIELIGFSDASQKAYGACVYLRVKYIDKSSSVRLIGSKSRVAPLKNVSLPRLELCASLLLARLVHKLKNIFTHKTLNTYLFTDSEIVLHWLKGAPSQWTVFVANRVSEIQDLTVNCIWSHIPSKQNPADYVSRGMDPETLLHCNLWWRGPEFLQNSENIVTQHADQQLILQTIPEQRKVSCNVQINNSLFSRFSKFVNMQRTIAYCLRFINNCNVKQEKIIDSYLTVDEMQNSLQVIIKCVQLEFFQDEILCLSKNKPLKSSSSIISLNPFLDQNGILRVGGRIHNASISYAQKHPILLSNKSHVVELLIKQEHERLGHAGPQSVLCNLRLKYWPINALRLIKKVIKNCVTCHRFKAVFSQQLMGSLPPERVASVRPFRYVGVDFAGPLMVRESKLRKAKVFKAYTALFVCMNTKAVHIELVSDLSTNNFLLSLKRFIARRGVPAKIFSDNATNFKGAHNNMRELFEFFKAKSINQMYDYLSSRSCQWVFIPPNSPHWGGLWEAGVKSMKFHLKRVIGNSVLTFEQLTTLLCQIESILNSRPLVPNSTNSDDLTCLTPGHFIIGESFAALPEKDTLHVPDNRLSDFNLLTKMRQHFWQRWHVEYLHQLQNRPKWMTTKGNLKRDMLVILKEDNLPPMEWPLARIVEVMPGPDNKVRVVTVKTAKGTFTRPITKVSPLPFESVEDHNLQRGGGCCETNNRGENN